MAVKPIKVSQLNGYIKRVLQTDPILGNVSVIGEISNLKFHSSGHVYFTLKDENSRINCFLAAGNLKNIRYELSENMEITAFGYINLYEPGGTYSLNIRDIEVAGIGDLAIAFEKLKEKLAKEGIFEESHKKPIPGFPSKVAVVTSESGAAVKDILKIIKSRNNITNILIYPVLVQGPGAAGEISSAIDDINKNIKDTDLMIVGRGGGSMEDLWAFNEEIVARSIYNSKIPVISAVGHETDFTIADFAADRRAETPTAAAQMAVPDIGKLKEYLRGLDASLKVSLKQAVRYREIKLQRYDMRALGQSVKHKIKIAQMQMDSLQKSNLQRAEALIGQYKKQIDMHKLNLDSSSPKNIMKKGYAAVLDSDRSSVSSTKKLKKDSELTLVFADGDADCRVTDVRRE